MWKRLTHNIICGGNTGIAVRDRLKVGIQRKAEKRRGGEEEDRCQRLVAAEKSC